MRVWRDSWVKIVGLLLLGLWWWWLDWLVVIMRMRLLQFSFCFHDWSLLPPLLDEALLRLLLNSPSSASASVHSNDYWHWAGIIIELYWCFVLVLGLVVVPSLKTMPPEPTSTYLVVPCWFLSFLSLRTVVVVGWFPMVIGHSSIDLSPAPGGMEMEHRTTHTQGKKCVVKELF